MEIEDIERRIDAEYLAGGYGLGWRLLASPVNCLSGRRVAFLGLNPGGSGQDPEHPVLAPISGSAYVTESWAGYAPGASPLRSQVQSLCRALDVVPEHMLAGNLVPFRSPSWASLPNRARALAFGRELWGELLNEAKPEIVVSMGGVVFEALLDLFEVSHVGRVNSGWGNVGIRHGTARNTLLVGLPHLSRYGLFGRPKSEAALKTVFGRSWKGQ